GAARSARLLSARHVCGGVRISSFASFSRPYHLHRKAQFRRVSQPPASSKTRPFPDDWRKTILGERAEGSPATAGSHSPVGVLNAPPPPAPFPPGKRRPL